LALALRSIYRVSNVATTSQNSLNQETLKWHYRLGHLNINSMNTLATKQILDNQDILNFTNLPLFEGCLMGSNIYKIPFPKASQTTYNDVLELIGCAQPYANNFSQRC
jgi:hypothetical protein